jgi:hypothetical protein
MERGVKIKEFDAISLSKLDETGARLLNRVESKYLMTVGQCMDFLTGISDLYRVLEVRNTRIGRYETIYFDNDSFITYLQHHNRKGTRYKLRYRHYEIIGRDLP